MPKSSLDGKRESVLPDETELPKWAKRRLGLNAGEQLDCPGVVKRLGSRPNDDDAARFTSTSRIALDAWLRRIVAAGADLQPLFAPLEALIGDGLVSRVQGNAGIYGQLPYDGQLLYPARLEAQIQALQREGADGQAARQRLGDLQQAIQTQGLYRQYGEPSPYVAVLLDLARQAEKLAKGDHLPETQRRNALGILLEPRSGVRIAWRERWDKQPDQRLQEWIRAWQNDELPDKAAYQLRELARQLDWAPAGLLEKEISRILQRKQAGHGTRQVADQLQGQWRQAFRDRCAEAGRPAQALAALVDEWLIARRLSQAV